MPKSVHRLVAIAFVPNPENKPEVNHIDANKKNNWDWNLEWVIHQENMNHVRDNNLIKNVGKGEDNPSSLYTNEQIHRVCQMLKDGYKNRDVIKATGVSKPVIREIKFEGKWQIISKLYNLPAFTRRGPNPKDLPQKIMSLVSSDKRTSEIIATIGLPNTDRSRSYVKSIRKKYKKKLSASTTIENDTPATRNDPDMEVFEFGW